MMAAMMAAMKFDFKVDFTKFATTQIHAVKFSLKTILWCDLYPLEKLKANLFYFCPLENSSYIKVPKIFWANFL